MNTVLPTDLSKTSSPFVTTVACSSSTRAAAAAPLTTGSGVGLGSFGARDFFFFFGIFPQRCVQRLRTASYAAQGRYAEEPTRTCAPVRSCRDPAGQPL